MKHIIVFTLCILLLHITEHSEASYLTGGCYVIVDDELISISNGHSKMIDTEQGYEKIVECKVFERSEKWYDRL